MKQIVLAGFFSIFVVLCFSAIVQAKIFEREYNYRAPGFLEAI